MGERRDVRRRRSGATAQHRPELHDRDRGHGRRRAPRARQERAYAARVGRSALPSGRTDYRQLEDYQRELKDIAARFPALVRPFTLKEKTFQGRDLQVIEIAEDVHDGDDGRPVLFVNGIHHAREWPATESVMEFAWDLVQNHGKDARITRILRDVRIMIMPFTNTDGFVVSRARDRSRRQRGARRALPDGHRGRRARREPQLQAQELQPAGAHPRLPVRAGDRGRQQPQLRRGLGRPRGVDQPERPGLPRKRAQLRARDACRTGAVPADEQHGPPVDAQRRGQGAASARPRGGRLRARRGGRSRRSGKKIADATGYTNEYGWQLYDTTGTTKDWVYAATGSFGYTVELGARRLPRQLRRARRGAVRGRAEEGRPARGLPRLARRRRATRARPRASPAARRPGARCA